jgi:hypothetical protein
MCPSVFAPSFVQVGLYGAINMVPRRQVKAGLTWQWNYQFWISHHDWMRSEVEVAVEKQASARLDQVYAGNVLPRMMGKGKGKVSASSLMGKEKAERAVMMFAYKDVFLARQQKSQQHQPRF